MKKLVWFGMRRVQVLMATLSLVIVCCVCHAAEEKTGVALSKDIAAVRATLDEKDETGKNIITDNYRSQILSVLNRVERKLEQEDFQSAVTDLESIFGWGHPPEKTRSQLDGLIKVIKAQAKLKEEQRISEAQELLSRIPAVCAATTNENAVNELLDHVSSCLLDLQHSRDTDRGTVRIRTVRDKMSNAEGFLREYAEAIRLETSGNYVNALQQLDAILSNSSYSLLCPVESLQKKKKELSVHTDAMINNKLAEVRELLLKADTRESVEKIHSDFQIFSQRFSRHDYTKQSILERSQQAISSWMTVISAEQSGDIERALQALASLDRSELRNTPVLTGKDIAAKKASSLKRLIEEDVKADSAAIQLVDEYMKKASSLDELLKLADKFQKLAGISQGTGSDMQEINALVADLQTLTTAYNASNTSQTFLLSATQAGNRFSRSHRWTAITNTYRQQMLLKLLSTACRLGPLELERKDQTVTELLLSLADKASAKKDWNRVSDLLDAYRICVTQSGQQPSWLVSELAGCRSFLFAQNLEKAGMYAAAADAYVNVLSNASQRTPTEEALKCLKKLKTEHPEAFAGQQGAHDAQRTDTQAVRQ